MMYRRTMRSNIVWVRCTHFARFLRLVYPLHWLCIRTQAGVMVCKKYRCARRALTSSLSIYPRPTCTGKTNVLFCVEYGENEEFDTMPKPAVKELNKGRERTCHEFFANLRLSVF